MYEFIVRIMYFKLKEICFDTIKMFNDLNGSPPLFNAYYFNKYLQNKSLFYLIFIFYIFDFTICTTKIPLKNHLKKNS